MAPVLRSTRANPYPMPTSFSITLSFITIPFVFSGNAFGQNVSLGVIGGASPTGDFQKEQSAPPPLARRCTRASA
jgi:hypothetical protein